MNLTGKKRIISLIMCAVIILGYISGTRAVYCQASALTGTVSSDVTSYLNVRTGPGTNYAILKDKSGNDVTLTAGKVVTIISTHDSTDGISIRWYKVTFPINGSTLTGYVRSDYIIVKVEPIEEELPEDFENSISGFPNSYKPYLRALHLVHPNWIFKPLKTNLSWNTVVFEETKLGRSLTSSSIISYRSTAPGAYDWSTDKYFPLDAGGWYQAADDVVRHYLDPRNFLDERSVFQFEALYYDASTQTRSGVESMLEGTFMAGKYISNGKAQISYAQAFIDAAAASGASPYHLASRVIQEVGRQGSDSVWGLVDGYEGIYNFFNIGATSGTDPIINGLRFAKTGGSLSEASKTKYLIPWDSQYKSIVGGSKYIAANYINIGQNTLYLQKFDVDNSDGQLYWHQYMTNISAANSEAGIMYTTYKELGKLGLPITFSIPVYNNMPAEKCPLPEARGNPNNLLKTLSVTNYSITPTFEIESENSTYYLIIEGNIKTITVNAATVSSLATVSGNKGTVSILQGINNLKVSVKAQNGDIKTYNLVVVLNDGDFQPGDETTKPPVTEPATTVPSTTEQPTTKPSTTAPSTTKPTTASGYKTSYKLHSNKTLTGVQPLTSVSRFITNLGLYGGASAFVTNAAGKKVTSGNVGTGFVLNLTVNGVQSKYAVIIKGDTNGDGAVSAIDLLMVRKVILKAFSLSSCYLTSADVNADGKVSAIDLLMIRKHILKAYKIVQ